jgi:hypothetical protein
MMKLIADYKREHQAFKNFVHPDSYIRILFFRGMSGCGKTTLILHCLRDLPADIPCVSIEFKDRAVNITEIFSRVGNHVGLRRKQKSVFIDAIASLQGASLVQVKRSLQAGWKNQITVVLNVEDPINRDERRVYLTEALFEDLKRLSHPLLLAIDTFEQATSEVRQWLAGPFLARVVRVNHLRVLLAGQIVPDNNTIEWGRQCTCLDLCGVRDAEPWLPIVRDMHRQVPSLEWLAGVCYALKGNPDEIMKIIEGLPRVLSA